MGTQSQRAKGFIEEECSRSNYCSLGSNRLSVRSANFYLSVQSHITERDSYCPSFFPTHVQESIWVETLNASNHTKVIPDLDGKCNHHTKVWRSIIFTFRSIQTDEFSPNQYPPCARHSTRGEEYKAKTQSFPLSSKNPGGGESQVK